MTPTAELEILDQIVRVPYLYSAFGNLTPAEAAVLNHEFFISIRLLITRFLQSSKTQEVKEHGNEEGLPFSSWLQVQVNKMVKEYIPEPQKKPGFDPVMAEALAQSRELIREQWKDQNNPLSSAEVDRAAWIMAENSRLGRKHPHIWEEAERRVKARRQMAKVLGSTPLPPNRRNI